MSKQNNSTTKTYQTEIRIIIKYKKMGWQALSNKKLTVGYLKIN